MLMTQCDAILNPVMMTQYDAILDLVLMLETHVQKSIMVSHHHKLFPYLQP